MRYAWTFRRGLCTSWIAPRMFEHFVRETPSSYAVPHLPPPQVQRVAVINVSAFTLTAIQPLLLMLPSHVRERVHILGADWEQFLAADLDEEALSFLKDADRHTLASHRGRYLREAPRDGQIAAVG